MSVRLRPVRESDDAWLESWLPPLASALGYHRDVAGIVSSDGIAAHIIVLDGEDAGVIAHARMGTHAVIELVATPPTRARRGAGMRAAALLEAELSRAGVRSIYAPVAETHGISMYFWIRLGYRPLLRGEWPCVRDGVAWLRRDIRREEPSVTRTASRRGSR